MLEWPKFSDHLENIRNVTAEVGDAKPTLKWYSRPTRKGKEMACRMRFSFSVCSTCFNLTTWKTKMDVFSFWYVKPFEQIPPSAYSCTTCYHRCTINAINSIWGEIYRHMCHEEEQKTFFLLQPGCLGLRAVWGIFFAWRRPEKISQTALRPKQARLKQNKCFCFSKW